MATLLLLLLAILATASAFAAGFTLGNRRTVVPAPREPPFDPETATRVRFESLAARETDAWREAMAGIGTKLAAADVRAVVFVHGTFTGTDPLSAYAAVERALSGRGRELARSLRKRTRAYVERVLGDFGNFSSVYVRLFEQATGGTIPCTTHVWSSENHHVGRLEGALGLVRVLAAHAELAPRAEGSRPRLLLMGHSHAGQVFALVTQLLSRSIASEAILDVARARGLDVGALETDLATLGAFGIDVVTFGAPVRYAWAAMPGIRVVHVHNAADWIHRFGGDGSDFPAWAAEDRRVNAMLGASLGGGFSPSVLLSTARSGPALPERGHVVLVDYGTRALARAVRSGLGHAMYTRLDAMLFHATLVAERLYRDPGDQQTAIATTGTRIVNVVPDVPDATSISPR